MNDAIATRGESTRREKLQVANEATDAQNETERDQASTGGLFRCYTALLAHHWIGFVPLLQGPFGDPTPTYRRLMGDWSAFTRAPCPSLDGVCSPITGTPAT